MRAVVQHLHGEQEAVLTAGLSPPRRRSCVADFHGEAPAVARRVRHSAPLHLAQSGADLAARVAARLIHQWRDLQRANASLPASASGFLVAKDSWPLLPIRES